MADKQLTLLELLKQYKRGLAPSTVPAGAPFLEVVNAVAADVLGRIDDAQHRKAFELLALIILNRSPVTIPVRSTFKIRIDGNKANTRAAIAAVANPVSDKEVALSQLRPHISDLKSVGLLMPMVDVWCDALDSAEAQRHNYISLSVPVLPQMVFTDTASHSANTQTPGKVPQTPLGKRVCDSASVTNAPMRKAAMISRIKPMLPVHGLSPEAFDSFASNLHKCPEAKVLDRHGHYLPTIVVELFIARRSVPSNSMKPTLAKAKR